MPRLASNSPALAGLLAILATGCLSAPAHAALPQQQAGAVDLASARPNSVADGSAGSDSAGTFVADAGDVNGDGIEDAIVTALNADANGRRDSGSAWVVFGRTDGASLDLRNLGTGGFRIDGQAASDHLGFSAAAAGDMNGDGRGDVIVGARDADNRGRGTSGSAYVIFGRSATTPVDLAALGSQGFRIDGAAANDRAGSSVAGGGDVNGDGRPDIVVTAPQADRNTRTNSGTAYVVFGKAGPGDVDTAALGSSGYAIDGAVAGDQLGAAALTRDLSGDGRADVLLGARFADGGGRVDSGAVYVLAGKGDSTAVDLSAPGASAYSAAGATALDGAGATVAQGGDLNGDGAGDLLVGAPGTDYNGRAQSGSAYVLLGLAGGGAHDLAALDSAWRVDGAAAGDAAGTALDANADVNSDGRTDLAVGSPTADARGRTDSGSTGVLYGGGFGGVTDLAAGTPGFRSDGGAPGDQSGTSVALLRDANGDGRGDLVLGAPGTDHLGRGNSGSAYLLWGFGTSTLAYPGAIATTVNQPIAPLQPQSIVRTGAVSFTIDPPLPAGLALDARSGVISGAPSGIQEQPSTYRLTMTDLTGSVTVPITLRVAPAPGPCANARDGGAGDDTITGTSGGDRIDAHDGNDSVQGMTGDDCLLGDAGLDTLAGGDGNDQLGGGLEHDALDGGAGNDRLAGDGGQDSLAGDAGDDALQGGTGFDELDGGSGNDALAGQADSDALTGGSGDDRLDGGGAADQLVGGAGRDMLIGGDGNDIISDLKGGAKVDAGAGADVVNVHNGVRDRVRCGRGRDRVVADRGDRLSGCEKVNWVRAKKKKRRRHR